MRRCFLLLLTIAVVNLFCGSLPLEAAPRYAGISHLAGQPALVLVNIGNEPTPILYRADAHAQEKQAAEQLAAYLSQIGGVEFIASKAPDPLPDRAVLVGEFEMTMPPQLTREGFLIRTEGQRLYLRGGSHRATMYAVFCLLEEQLGCRWWSWNEEFVPRSAAINVTAQDTHIEPAFRIHDLFNKEGQSPANAFVYKRRGASGTSYTSVHNLCPMLKPHAENHPDFLPMDKDGQRKFNNVHMNYTAAGMAEIVADVLDKEVVRRNGNIEDYFYFAGMGDWYGGMDLSPESQRVYEQETWTDPDGRRKPGYSATMLKMVNRAAELLDQEHPGVTVATHAYMSLEAPPAKTRPRDNVVIEIPRLRHDTVRSIEESDKNQSFRRNLDRWCELAPGRVTIWEYGTNFNHFIKPFPCLRSIAANLRYYEKAGVAGVRIQGNYVSLGSDLVVLKNYVWGKMLWDPTRDVDELIQEFCLGYYGPAADEMIAYVNLVEGSVRGQTPVSADEFEKDFTKWMRPEVVQHAEALFARALAKTKGDDADPHYRRVKEAQVSLEAFQLWTDGELVEQGDKLVRKDLGGDTLPRARDLLKYCRAASPREWGDGRAYRMSFLPTHGGPLATLTNGSSLSVKVAPLQAGQIRSVHYGQAVAIDESRDLPNPGARLYEMIRHEPNRVDMKAELGVAHWGSNTKQIVFRTVEVPTDGTIHITGAIQLAAGVRQNTNQPSSQTIYHCDSPDQVVVEYLDENKQWIEVKIDAKTTKAEIALATDLRVVRRDRNLTILDQYRSPNPPSALIEYLPKSKDQVSQLRVTVRYGTITINAERPTTYVEREIQITNTK